MKKSPYAHIDLDIQKLRAGFALIVFGKALLELDFLEGTKKDMQNMERLSDWHLRASEELGKNPPERKYEYKFGVSMQRFNRLASTSGFSREKRKINKAAMYVATRLLLLDSRITCPGVARTKAWLWLDRAAGKLEDLICRDYPAADEAGHSVYEKLAWDAERRVS